MPAPVFSMRTSTILPRRSAAKLIVPPAGVNFDGIIHNIIHDLMHKIRVRVNQQRIAAQTLDVVAAVLDALLVRRARRR